MSLERDYITSLIGVPYKVDPPYSLTMGYNCLYFAAFIWEYYTKEQFGLTTELSFTDVRTLRNDFVKLEGPPYQKLDLPLFWLDDLSLRHIGVLQDSKMMIHCSINTNGVARSDITKLPWAASLKGVYRHKSLCVSR